MKATCIFNKRTEVGFEFQAKKFPCFKDVKSQWKFNWQAEETKRFGAGGRQPPQVMWDPTIISNEQVKLYLTQV